MGSSHVSGIVETILDAGALQTPLRIAGRAHWMDAGRPSSATRMISLTDHTGIVDYVPGDLTITVRAGTTLAEIDRVTKSEGQWLPLVPHGTSDGTIGATIATGSSGPLAHGFGRARDLVLGLEFVTGDGKVVRGGGRVVKNVAGFDLVRLLTGSWGTLGVITEVSLRLYSLPSRPVTLALNLPDGAGGIAQRIGAILGGAVTPFAVEIIDAAVAARSGLPPRTQVLVQLGGNAPAVNAQRDALAKLGGVHEVAGDVWGELRTIELPRGDTNSSRIVMRLSALPARVAEVWTNAARVTAGVDGAMMHATPSLGLVRCILPADAPVTSIAALAASGSGVTCVYERLAPEMWKTLSPSVTSDRLSQGMRRAFDPMGILNSGILGALNGAETAEVI